MRKELLIVIPAYNEKDNIENTVNLDDPNEPNTNSLQNHNFMQSVFDNKNRNHYHFPNEQLPSVVQSEQKQNCALHKQTSTMFLANKEITALLEFGNKVILLGSKDGGLSYIKIETVNNKNSFKKIYCYPICKEAISHMCRIDNMKIAVSSLDGKVSIYNITETGVRHLNTLSLHKGLARMVVLGDNNTCLSCGSDGYVCKIDVSSFRAQHILKEDSEITSIFKLNQSRRDILITSCLDSFSLGLWNLTTNQKEFTIPNVHSFSPNGIIELPGKRIVVANYSEPISLTLIDINSGRIIRRIKDKTFIKANTSIYLRENSLYCISNKSFCQISLHSFDIENKLIDPEIKSRAGLTTRENGKYILIPNSKNGINVYTFP